MIEANVRIPTPINEPVLAYSPGSAERAQLKSTLQKMAGERAEIPLLIGRHCRANADRRSQCICLDLQHCRFEVGAKAAAHQARARTFRV